MRIFSLKVALIIIVVYFLIITIISGHINAYFGLHFGMYISAISPLPVIIYFLIYIWKWNNGTAKFP